jgi:hypothetical protein
MKLLPEPNTVRYDESKKTYDSTVYHWGKL